MFPFTWHPLAFRKVSIEHNCENPSPYREIPGFTVSVAVSTNGKELTLSCSDCGKVVKHQLPRD